MISMNKVFKTFERYFENLAEARVNAALITLDRDPWSLSLIPNRRYEALESARAAAARTTKVQQDCTDSGQTTAANDSTELALVKYETADEDIDNRRSAA